MVVQWSYGPMRVWSILGFLLIFTSLINGERRASEKAGNRTFEINYDEDSFWMDGEPFRYVSGSLHYFRSPHETWRERLRTLRSAGLNAVSTYVEWSFHEPERGQFRWTGDYDLVNFIEIAQEEDLYVVLRPGPYICAERDMGGLPYWLLSLYPNIRLRTNDLDYKREVAKWYSELMTRLTPLFYGNGGPIITVQVENEYGFFYACDEVYMTWLSEMTQFWVQDAAVLFTTDGPSQGALTCGSAPGAYSTVDFGTGQNVADAWSNMRQISPRGPLVNSEFYPGWMTHWGDQPARVSTEDIVRSLETMMEDNANVNFYMFHGGTNFEFSAGANSDPYTADVTSYDYDAPMTEAGDPTSKYLAIRDVLLRYLPEPPYPPPAVKAKFSSGEAMFVEPVMGLLSARSRLQLGEYQGAWMEPPTMEQVGQRAGLILYESLLPATAGDVALLTLQDLRDRALIYLDGEFIGALSRHESIYSLPVIESSGHSIQIIVENQGRINFGTGINDFKGIVGNVTLGNTGIFDWNVTSFPLESVGGYRPTNESIDVVTEGVLLGGPVLYTSHFQIEEEEALDSYLDLSGWGKGFVWINGRHLGRYWPNEGPQVTLYVPGVYLELYPATNFLMVMELQKAPSNQTVNFLDYPIGI